MPINYKKYSDKWFDVIRPDILKRDNFRCKWCGIRDRVQYYWESGQRVIVDDEWIKKRIIEQRGRIKRVILTIAHIDQNIYNNDYSNLAALCQLCHNRHDIRHRILNRKTNAGRKTTTGIAPAPENHSEYDGETNNHLEQSAVNGAGKNYARENTETFEQAARQACRT